MDPERFKSYHTNYKMRHPDRIATAQQKNASNPVTRYRKLLTHAARKNREVTLTFEEYVQLIQDNKCEYCGKPLSATGYGLDVKNAEKRLYSFDNVVPCCTECNRIKSDCLTHDEMKAVVKLVRQIRNERAQRQEYEES